MNRLRSMACAGLAALLAAACAFFVYYTVRLIYVNLVVPGAASHRQWGMYVGAVIFPLAAFVFGYLSLRFARMALG